MDNKSKVPNFKQIGNELLINSSRYAASEAVNFFKDSFVKGGFTDVSFQKWAQTNNPLAGKHTMYKRGNLMRSVHKKSTTKSRVVVESNEPHSNIHNEGGTITVTPQMKKFFWAKYYELVGKVTTNKKGAVSLNKSNRATGAKAMFCKRMALMPVGAKVKIPKRQFMGNSVTLMKDFDSWFVNTVKTQVEPQLNNPTVTITVTDI